MLTINLIEPFVAGAPRYVPQDETRARLILIGFILVEAALIFLKIGY
jgi:hypothetical protein